MNYNSEGGQFGSGVTLYADDKVIISTEDDLSEGWVNHPPYYQGKIEVIDFIEDRQLGFHLGNAIKYIARSGRKSPDTEVEDLEKAIWYIERYIALKGGK